LCSRSGWSDAEERCCSCRVPAHPPSRRGDVGGTCQTQQADGQVAQRRHCPWPRSGSSHLVAVLEYVKKVLTRVVAVAGGGSRRVTKEPGGCLHLVINFGIVISGQTSSPAALSCFFFPSSGSLECPSKPPQASSFPGPGASPNRKQPRQHIMWTLKL